MNTYRKKSDGLPFANTPFPWTLRLVALNVTIYVLLLLSLKTTVGMAIFNEMVLVPQKVFSGHIWQLVTYMFLHSPNGIMHVAFNMLLLWMMGREVEMTLGSGTFLRLYFLTGIVAGICSLFTGSPVLGASGAVLGILAVYGHLFPDRMILAFFFIPMKVKHFIWVVAAMDLMGAINGGGNIAHLAHIGGLFAGIVMMRTGWYRKRFFDVEGWKRQRDLESHRRRRDRVDEILAKVSREGIQSLKKDEREFLERMRRDR